MKHRELAFYPESERTRDLLYSEYGSCNRSIHVLLHDNPASPQRFLLGVYREVVSRFLSSSHIEPPLAFVRSLTDALETILVASHASVADFDSIGLYMLLRAADADYVLVSRDGSVMVHRDGDFTPLTEAEGVERVRIDPGDVQEELFPQRLGDSLLLFRLDRERFRRGEIVFGCSEEEKSAVSEALADAAWQGSRKWRDVVSSRFVTRKLLAVRVDESAAAMATDAVLDSFAAEERRRRRRTLAIVGSAAVVVIAATFVAMRAVGPEAERDAASMESVSGPEVVTAPPPTSASTEETPPLPRFAQHWTRSFDDPVTSSPVLFETLVVFGCRDGNVYALERESGKSVWTAKHSQGIGASPAIEGSSVVIADYGGVVSALDARTGTKRWNRSLPMRVVSSPVIDEDRVLVGCYDGFAYCLSISDGSILWKRRTGGRIRGTACAGSGRYFVPSYDGYLYALSRETGEVAWRYRLRGHLAGSPAFSDDIVVIGSPAGTVYAFNAADGTVRWTRRTSGAVKSMPLVAAGRVYIGSNDSRLYCLDLADGSVLWQFKTGDVVLARPGLRDGMVYVGSYDGYVYCLDADSGELVDRAATEGAIYSSPVVDGEALYVGNNEGRFICVRYRPKGAS